MFFIFNDGDNIGLMWSIVMVKFVSLIFIFVILGYGLFKVVILVRLGFVDDLLCLEIVFWGVFIKWLKNKGYLICDFKMNKMVVFIYK